MISNYLSFHGPFRIYPVNDVQLSGLKGVNPPVKFGETHFTEQRSDLTPETHLVRGRAGAQAQVFCDFLLSQLLPFGHLRAHHRGECF